MSDDPLRRAQQQLARYGAGNVPAVSQSIDKKRLNALIARGREAAALTSKFAERVLIDMTCSATGGSYAAVAERDGTRLLLVGAMPSTGRDAGDPPQPLSGSYTALEVPRDWACPECRTPGPTCSLWLCHCSARNGAVHCGSTGDKASYCACGRYEQRHLVHKESVVVSGASFGVASQKPPNSSTSRPVPGSLRLSHSKREK